MLFNSIDFAVFLPIVFALYWLIPKTASRVRNSFLIIASYVFYGWWDWRFLGLIIISSTVDYGIGLALGRSREDRARKALLILSLISNLGILFFFKYYGFFVKSFVDVFSLFGRNMSLTSLNIVLPVGISFYTFQTLSYTIDVYREDTEPTRDFLAFYAYVSFFPQLVAGPIEKAKSFLPQFLEEKVFNVDEAIDGLRQILWGLFKKIVIADSCAVLVEYYFSHYQIESGLNLILASVLFSFQIYGDFSGYTDIAIGTGKLFGFHLMKNFDYPYFSRNIYEFWQKWHISLTSWFRDYVYIPLGGNRRGRRRHILNVIIIFLLSGLWHGANWTFVMWGGFHAICYTIYLFVVRRRSREWRFGNNVVHGVFTFFSIVITFLIISVAWVFFRSDSVSQSFDYFHSVLVNPFFSFPEPRMLKRFAWIFLLLIFEWVNRNKPHGLSVDASKISLALRWPLYALLGLTILLMGGNSESFIYFQF